MTSWGSAWSTRSRRPRRTGKLDTADELEIRADERPLEAAARALTEAAHLLADSARPRYIRVPAVVDARSCGGCKWLYGFTPYKEKGTKPRMRWGETKWCPKCESPQKVLLRPTVWQGVPIVPFRYVDLMAAWEMAEAMGIGEPAAPPELDLRSVEERMTALGLEVA